MKTFWWSGAGSNCRPSAFQITILPRDLAKAQAAARNAETTIPFWADYARRAGVEGTMHQAASHGVRRARYRGLPKTRLDHTHVISAIHSRSGAPAVSGPPCPAGAAPVVRGLFFLDCPLGDAQLVHQSLYLNSLAAQLPSNLRACRASALSPSTPA